MNIENIEIEDDRRAFEKSCFAESTGTAAAPTRRKSALSSFHNGNLHGQLKGPTREHEIRLVQLDSINVDDAQMRPVNKAWVKKCAKGMQDGAEFPPPEVCEERDEASGKVTTRLTNGRHRVEAMKMLGIVEAECVVRQGDLTAALMDAASSNIEALRLTRADKRWKVSTVLTFHRHWTDNRIATHCGVVPTFVKDVRADYDAEHGIAEGDTGVRESIDGRLISPRAPKPVPASRGADPVEAPDVSAQKLAEPAARGLAREQQAPREPPDAQGTVQAPTDVSCADGDKIRTDTFEVRICDADEFLQQNFGRRDGADASSHVVQRKLVAESSGKPGRNALSEQDADDDTAELAGSVLKLKFTTRSGAESEALFDLDNPDGPLHDDLIVLRPTMKNFKTLYERRVTRAAMDAILDRIWGVQ